MGCHKIELALAFLVCASLACFSYGLPSEYSIVGGETVNFPAEERVVELFRLWREKHRKVYNHVEEHERRFENFKRNLRVVLEKHAQKKAAANKHDTQRVGLNKFADLSNEEFRAIYMPKKVRMPISKRDRLVRKMQQQKKAELPRDAPASLDWRKAGIVTPVKDQGSCGMFQSLNSVASKYISIQLFANFKYIVRDQNL